MIASPQVPPAPWTFVPAPDPLAHVKTEVLTTLQNEAEPLYALVDAARNDRILELLRQHATSAEIPDPPAVRPEPISRDATVYQCLYLNGQIAELSENGPYLVQLPKDSGLLSSLIGEGWGDSWGVFLTSAASFTELRSHFRHFVMVYHPVGGAIFFRFFDPRVLRAFIPVCTPEEMSQFFGPVLAFLIEDERGRGATSWSLDLQPSEAA